MCGEVIRWIKPIVEQFWSAVPYELHEYIAGYERSCGHEATEAEYEKFTSSR